MASMAVQILSAHSVQRLAQRFFSILADRFGFLLVLQLRRLFSPTLVSLHFPELLQGRPLIVLDPFLDGLVHL
jgi:hypothetical protein